MRKRGRIVDWNDVKGYGFIDSGAGGRQAFVHINDFPRKSRRPVDGDEVMYSEATDNRGRPKAADARLVGGGFFLGAATKALVVAVVFLLIVVLLAVFGLVPWAVPAWYALASLISVPMYFLDKQAAQSGARRIPEAVLHLVALAGGWPGCLYAQQLFHHKTRKVPFLVVFAIVAILNVAALVYLCVTGKIPLAGG